MVSQFIRLDQCRRYLRLALHQRAAGPGFLYQYDVAPQAITPLLTTAKRSGAPAFGGIGLLLHQAAISFELWTGQPAPMTAMSAAALAALAEEPSAAK